MKKLLFIFLLPALAVAQDLKDVSPKYYGFGSGSTTTHTIDGATDSLEFCAKAERALSFTKIGFLYGTRTGTPVAHKIGVQGQNTSTGRANGTYKTGTGECSGAFTPPASTAWNDGWQWVNTTGTTCSVTQGESFCFVMTTTGVPDSSNSGAVAYRQSVLGDPDATKYSFRVDAGTPTQSQDIPPYALGSSTDVIGFPYEGYDQNFFSSDGTPDEYGNRFIINCPATCTYTVGLASMFTRVPDNGKQFYVSLYDGTTILQRVTVDSTTLTTPTTNRPYSIPFDETTLSNLTCGSVYRIAAQAVSLSMNWMIPAFIVDTNADLDAFTFGKDFYQTSRTNEGAWTDVTNKRIAVYPVIRSISCSGSGGGLINLNTVSGGVQ